MPGRSQWQSWIHLDPDQVKTTTDKQALIFGFYFQTIETFGENVKPSLKLLGIKLLFHSRSVITPVNSLGRKAVAFYSTIEKKYSRGLV